MGGRCRAGGSADFGCVSSGLGARQRRWAVFFGSINVRVAGLLEGQIDATTANGVRWGSHSTLVAAVSHFLVLKAELEVLGSGCSANLIEDEVDAF
jgi:hypothetical protein